MVIHEFRVLRRTSKKTGNPYNLFQITWSRETSETANILYTFETFVTEEQAFILKQMLDMETNQ